MFIFVAAFRFSLSRLKNSFFDAEPDLCFAAG